MQTGTASSANSGKKGYSKASVQWFLDDRPYGKPHLSQQQTSLSTRVVALHSFVLLVCKVVSVFLLDRVYALMVNFVDQLPALYLYLRNRVERKQHQSLRDATGRHSRKRVTPPSAAGFCECQQAFSQHCMHSLL